MGHQRVGVLSQGHQVAEQMRHARALGIELLTQTSGRVVPSYSYSCSLRCFSLSYSSDVNELGRVGGGEHIRFPETGCLNPMLPQPDIFSR